MAVDSRWAMSTAVRSSKRMSSAASIFVSDCRSRLEVASSRTSTRGWARKARARAMSCRSPDDSDWPRSWTIVSTPFGIRSIRSVSPTVRTASSTSSSEASGRAKAMLSRMVPAKRNGSWGTTPSWRRSDPRVTDSRSCPSMRTRPSVGS